MATLCRILCAFCGVLAVNAVQIWPFSGSSDLEEAAVSSSVVTEIGKILMYKTNFTNWVLNNCSEKPAEMRLNALRGNFLTSLLAAISAKGDQKTVNLCVAYLDSFTHEMEECATLAKSALVTRATTFKAHLQLAEHHKWMLMNGQDPLGLYALNVGAAFVPPSGQPPIKVAEWFLAKAASLDFFTHKAINTHSGLDDASLLTFRLNSSMAEAVDGFHLHKSMSLNDPDAVHAKFVLESLEAHVEHLGALLHAFGAEVVLTDPLDVQEETLAQKPELVNPAQLASQTIEDNLTYSVAFKPFIIEDCSAKQAEAGVRELERLSLTALLSGVSAQNDARYVTQGFGQIAVLRRMIRACDALSANDSTLLPRINEVQIELHEVEHHKWMVTNGQDPLGLYTFSKPFDFVLKAKGNLTESLNWMLGRVTGLDFLMHKAVSVAQGLDEAYLSAVQVQVMMQHLMDSMGTLNKTSSKLEWRTKDVVEALQGHVERLQSLLSLHGAQPPEPAPSLTVARTSAKVVHIDDEAALKYNTSFSPFALETCSKILFEKRLVELEDKSLTALMALVSRVGDPRTIAGALNATVDLKLHITECNITSWAYMMNRTNTIQNVLDSAKHHRLMVANGKDPVGLYQLNVSFTPGINIPFLEQADWFVAKVASVDFLTHKAVEGNGDLNKAYQVNVDIALAMWNAIAGMGLSTDAAMNKDMDAIRAALILQALIDHTKNLENLLQQHGAAA